MATMPATSGKQDVAQRLIDDGYVVVTGMMTPPACRPPALTWTGCCGPPGPAGTPSRATTPSGSTRCSPRPGRSTGGH